MSQVEDAAEEGRSPEAFYRGNGGIPRFISRETGALKR